MTPSDIESIERATLAAVSPEAVEEFQGWLLPFDGGTVSRAHSAVPLRHVPAGVGMVEQIEARYRARGLRTVFRLANEGCFDGLRQELARRGYQSGKPVLVQVAPVQAMRAASAAAPAETADVPDAAWAALFLAEGFDPVDGASRVKALSRARGSVYASVRENGKTVAAGAGAFSHGWSSVHGMRTDQACRGRGLAGRVLAGIAAVAEQRGIARAFLQVEDVNAPALALYRRAGFETVWSYDYWRQP
ncbi:sortase-like acyltransferase [Polaromonas sp. CF318]|uniref:GNAT family N-acetyltransferase n=1 Tax=Polaromonas sp. CF318 TaxID=1144318 RepID=UPI000270F1E5|nr:GNAT family N-acetyltransferase [Polaromonas sp. CF318]EJL86814.1 sortase-like acyltransferase [Polaromonas sp. CF318]